MEGKDWGILVTGQDHGAFRSCLREAPGAQHSVLLNLTTTAAASLFCHFPA